MTEEEYRGFLKEAFIHPLRSVLIVDDDYPTFEDMLVEGEPKGAAAKKTWRKDRERIGQVLQAFRDAEPPLIVDIHDGHNVGQSDETKVAKHLHQSDLLILDFSLNRNDPEDGTKAIGIVRTLFSNDHFNLVVVHSSTDQTTVFNDLVFGLLKPIGEILSDEERTGVTVRLAEYEDDHPTYRADALKTIGNEHYLAFRNSDAKWPVPAKNNPPSVGGFEQKAAEAGFVTKPDQFLLAKYLLELRERALGPKLGSKVYPGLVWSKNGTAWIRSDLGFVAFSDKRQNRDLLADLVQALENWGPPPSRLFLAKLRAQVDRVGVPAESKALENLHVLARWYSELLDADDAERDSRVQDAVDRHADLLFRQVSPGVGTFASRVIAADKMDTERDHCLHYFGVDFKDAAQAALATDEYNAFICSRTPSLRHLETGHVFEAEDRIWVCLTPICDLVPGRRKKSSDRFGKMDGILPFMAVRLHPIGALKSKPTTNRYIYLKLGGQLKAFALALKEGESPHWFNLYALNEGRFESGEFSYRRLELNAHNDLAPKKVRAKIVGQLQYEYALNLMQRLGFSMSRVGLDFIKRSADEEE
ncbi:MULTISPECIES: response regulator receiver domain [unclassified Brevundimonas]|uniref:response regulator receiver domain n=1 Tax=unclassified Brevundimonas TaxID=2622653 RepID=UPI000CFB198A|nr:MULTISPECIES: response regulator receiver domain [unclassified Brevundimonas]PRA27644.1 hypothetical protein CQ024_11185 [Brevundimonas sp. MYb27]PQZ84403.1 hypothetical protein CQ026_00950 [Brevundimonas sp. MYb31]PRB17637.1 hypothetical protein CQ039_00950 [Brevundimonas sp. MYb52]PRB38009.1 hypothetical protein CQ035_00950 [Brevundimonas sp. MYb46]PRB42000.1 hypothetical protein CQ028_15180 [Brevundimonas sp. MYb33]